MDRKSTIKDEFLQALKDVENTLSAIQFRQYSFLEKGFAYYVQYKREDCIVEFIFHYELYMIVYTPKGKFSFGDMMRMPIIEKWVNDNKYVQKDGRNLKNELLWFIELLQFSLPVLE